MHMLDIHLTLPKNLEPEVAETVEYDDELDDVRSVLRDICLSLHQAGGVAFHVTAGSPIAVSVRRDLCVAMEQFVDVLQGLNKRIATRLDLYEQGVEERLIFTSENEREVLVERRPLVDTAPAPTIKVHVQRANLLDMLCTLATCFLVGARARCPTRAQHHLFTSWAVQLEDEIRKAARTH